MVRRFSALLWIAAGVALLASSCATAPGDRARHDEAAIRAVLAGYARAVTTGDIELCRQLCAGEPRGLAPEGANPSEVWYSRTVSATTMAALRSRLAIEVRKVWAEGEWSMASGTFTLTPSAAEPAIGEYLALLKRQPDGGWKIAELRYGDLLERSFDLSNNP